jgi:transposase-like protein
VQRCQVHKARHVVGHLPNERHSGVRASIRASYKYTKVETANRLLNNLARTLRREVPELPRPFGKASTRRSP